MCETHTTFSKLESAKQKNLLVQPQMARPVSRQRVDPAALLALARGPLGRFRRLDIVTDRQIVRSIHLWILLTRGHPTPWSEIVLTLKRFARFRSKMHRNSRVEEGGRQVGGSSGEGPGV